MEQSYFPVLSLNYQNYQYHLTATCYHNYPQKYGIVTLNIKMYVVIENKSIRNVLYL